ncbi:dipeptide epimerase [Candidatus Sulfurimonas marisnigri]|uniref:Dipeptide epimerase n=1 Tax=Candidatus Sulfurimonas marisnigri TaxID=2740405 RepID=A0A7S7M0G9_9BACT|nr:dipeptide epimerase [Candidatus Sulfurimonas marisnigri]QOY54318.1 dipeptide epimerase [Candidatus Sulfurimonas marisnigri]
MKIAKITTEVKYIELKTPFKTALRETSHVEFVRVHVELENGLVGVGEAPATKAITGEGIEDILNSINSVKRDFINFDNIGSSAKAALDMAYVSLQAKKQKQTFIEYFNATDLSPLKTDITISLNSLDVMLEDAKKAYAENKSILKVKLGKDITHAIQVIKAISEELQFVEIIVDANQAWSLKDSLKFIDAMRDINIELIEQPVIASDLKSLKKITEYSHIPILADESVFTLDDAKKVIESKSADMINVKLMKCGGVTKAIEILEYARKNGVICMLGSMLEGPYSINIALHLAMSYRDVIKYIDLDSPLLYKKPSNELDFEFNGCEIVYNQDLQH